jgi:hypothetical protein
MMPEEAVSICGFVSDKDLNIEQSSRFTILKPSRIKLIT